MKLHGMKRAHMKSMKSSDIKRNQNKAPENKLDRMTSSEIKWNQMKPKEASEIRGNQVKSNETSCWNQVKSNDIKSNETQRNDWNGGKLVVAVAMSCGLGAGGCGNHGIAPGMPFISGNLESVCWLSKACWRLEDGVIIGFVGTIPIILNRYQVMIPKDPPRFHN